MRKILVITLLAIISITVHSQTSSDILRIHDTRDVNDAPNFNNYSIRADFKLRTTIGVPGNGTFSTNLTISPWRDDSGGYNHQLNFNDGGIYYRIGTHNSQTWDGWQKILTEDPNGEVKIGLHTEIWSGYGKRLTLSGVGDYSDDMWLSKYCRGNNMTDLRVNIGDDPDGDPNRMDRFIIGTTTPYNSTNWLSHFTVESGGNVGIGTENPTEKLDVDGNVKVGLHSENWSGYGNRLTLAGVGNYWDDIWLSKYCRGNNMTDLRVNIGDDPNGDPNGTDRFVIGTTAPYNSTNWLSHFTVESSGNVGIGTENPTEKLDVAGTIRAKEVKIEATGWADFVFDKSYDLPKLSDVEKHINDKQHLPGIPSEKEVLENGVNVVDMQAKLLQKIEELTLYVIEQDKQNKDLQKQVNELKAQLNERQP